jgi:hypothetical protein
MCCATGSLASTSALYIFKRPELILSHVLTADISFSIGECHTRDAVLICSFGQPRCKAGRATCRVDELDAGQVHVIL